MGTEDPTEMICGGPDAMPDARPVHRVYVDGFWMDATEVTNEEFARFIQATGFITVAERPPGRRISRTPRRKILSPARWSSNRLRSQCR